LGVGKLRRRAKTGKFAGFFLLKSFVFKKALGKKPAICRFWASDGAAPRPRFHGGAGLLEVASSAGATPFM